MTAYAGLIQQVLFFGCIVVMLTSFLTAALYPLCRGRLQRLGASTQASILLGICSFPGVATFMVLLAALLPSLLQLMGFQNDHCLGHAEGHQHFCLIHRPAVLDGQPLNVLASAFLLLVLAIGARMLLDLKNTWQFRNVLHAWPLAASEEPVHIMDTSVPLAFTSGILRPRIFLSTGLLQGLSEEEKALLMAHEKAHLERHDSLRSLLARTLSLAHLPWVRKSLLAQLHLASEKACDEAAARQTDSPHKVAELLLKIERLYQRHFPAHAPLALNVLGDNGNTLPERVEALLSPGIGAQFPRAVIFAVLGAGFLALAGHDLLHDWLEHVLDLLQG